MTTIMSNYDDSALINVKPVVQAIVKDTGITEESINKTMKFLYDCLNGIIPYETSIKILGNEKIENILNPLLGPNWVFLKNPASFDVTIEDVEINFGVLRFYQFVQFQMFLLMYFFFFLHHLVNYLFLQ